MRRDDSSGGLDRRCFLRLTALAGTVWAGWPLADAVAFADPAVAALPQDAAAGLRVIRAGCPAHNCGGRCLLTLHVQDGRVVRIGTDEASADAFDAPQLRACARGRAYRRRQDSPDRLLHPLRRVGRRGEGRFEQLSWDAALDLMAGAVTRVRQQFGNEAILLPYGTGSYGQLTGRQPAQRLLNLAGGSLGVYGNYSWACAAAATPTVYGTVVTGQRRQDWVHSRYILMWGWNPSEMRDGTNTEYYLRAAREHGARIVCIDPRQTPSAVALADEWVPIRPGTDAAMMSAMAHVMIDAGLYDAAFVASHCTGFDSTQMPDGFAGVESYRDYLFGVKDGTPKTPAWAERITGVPRATIERLAREYATQRPGVLYQGYGLQRRAYGEQVVRAGCALAALTGNVGIAGGWAGGLGLQAPDGGPLWTVFPTGENPVKATIPAFLWTEAVVRGRDLGPEHGLRGVSRLAGGIKLVYAVASNALVNQHANINRTSAILQDERLVEFIAVQDVVMTPTARFADLILPACTSFETWGVADGWKYGDEVFLMPKVAEPPGEAWSDYRICAALAGRLGVGAAFTEGQSEREWIDAILSRFRQARYAHVPALDAFESSNAGVHREPGAVPAVAFAEFRRDPVAHPLPTQSGRIEFFSIGLHAMNRPAEIPAVPKYIQEWESPFGPEAGQWPLQAVSFHSLARAHSTLEGTDWLEEAFPHRLFINPVDATPRGLSNGDPVSVRNARGELRVRCRITRRIMPGVVALPQGAWWTPDAGGIDRRGSVNVLTSERWTPLAFGTAQQTMMVEVTKG
jgi:anaerobic dimethyl sulfoxide reductase subunit A